VGQAANIAREAGRQLGQVGRDDVLPAVQQSYERHVAPVVDRGVRFSKNIVDSKVVPAVGGVIGSALSAWDVAKDKRRSMTIFGRRVEVAPVKSGPSVGAVIAVILGVAAAAGVVWAAWQTLRSDDELWVADDPLGTPET